MRIPPSTRIAPRAPISRPHSDAKWLSGSTPMPARTKPQVRVEPSPNRTRSKSSLADSIATTLPPRISSTPLARMTLTKGVVISESKGISNCRLRSTSVIPIPRRNRFSATSSEMKPPPIRTAWRTPGSRSKIRSVSSRVRSVKTPGNSPPGTSGTRGLAPGARMSLS